MYFPPYEDVGEGYVFGDKPVRRVWGNRRQEGGVGDGDGLA
jgi:hypothetical protein